MDVLEALGRTFIDAVGFSDMGDKEFNVWFKEHIVNILLVVGALKYLQMKLFRSASRNHAKEWE